MSRRRGTSSRWPAGSTARSWARTRSSTSCARRSPTRHAQSALDPVLERLFQAALHAGRRAHTWFGGSPRSLADLALDAIAHRVGQLEGRTILIVGVGRMGRLAALATARRGARVIITNRTEDRARVLARELDGTSIPFGADGVMPPIDGAILAIGGFWPIGPIDMERMSATNVLVADLSSPPALGAEQQSRLGTRYRLRGRSRRWPGIGTR